MSWPGWNRTSVVLRFKAAAPLPTEQPATGPRSVSNRCLTLTRRPLCLLSYRGEVSSARFQRALPTSSRWCLLPLGYEDMEPPPGADPGHPPYEGGAAAVRGGKATGAGIEPAWPRFRALMGCQQPTRYQCGRRESNAQAARFELARYASSLHSRMVRHQGLEP